MKTKKRRSYEKYVEMRNQAKAKVKEENQKSWDFYRIGTTATTETIKDQRI